MEVVFKTIPSPFRFSYCTVFLNTNLSYEYLGNHFAIGISTISNVKDLKNWES